MDKQSVRVVDVYPDESWSVSPEIFETKSLYQCPNCQTPMMIAGKYSRKPREEQSEGVSKEQQHQCHNCNKRVIPNKLGE